MYPAAFLTSPIIHERESEMKITLTRYSPSVDEAPYDKVYEVEYQDKMTALEELDGSTKMRKGSCLITAVGEAPAGAAR